MAATARPSIVRLAQRLIRSNPALGQSGFTLIEAMLIAAMLAVTVMTYSSMHYQRMKLLKTTAELKQMQQVQNSVINAAGQSGAITATEELMYDPNAPVPSPSP